MVYATVASLIGDAAVELGLVSADIVDPYASADPNILQLVRLLKSGGSALARYREWSHLQKEFTFPTVNGQNAYPLLPTDFLSLVPNSGWNRTSQIPLGGPVGAEYWQFRQAVAVGSVYYTNIRFWKGEIFLEATPASVMTIAFEYRSSFWAGISASTLPNGNTLDAPTDKAHVVFFDPQLVRARLKLDYRKAKGFNTATEQDDYDAALYAAELQDSPAGTIWIGGRPNGTPRKLDRWNVPDTGVGQ